MKWIKLFMFLSLALSIASCHHEPANKHAVLSAAEAEKINQITPLSHEEGIQRLTTQCYACHNPNSKSHDDMLAPPLVGIKYRYAQAYPDRDLFIARMTDFIQEPSKENSVMRGPVKRFGLMPIGPLSQDSIREIVAYIYDNKLETPNWFAEHFEEENNMKWTD